MAVVITTERLEELRTPSGGYNEAAMSIIGYWPLQEGWKERLIGLRVSDRNWKAAIKAAARGPQHRFRGNTRRC